MIWYNQIWSSVGNSLSREPAGTLRSRSRGRPKDLSAALETGSGKPTRAGETPKRQSGKRDTAEADGTTMLSGRRLFRGDANRPRLCSVA